LKVLILSASIGEGHDLPARVLAEAIEQEAPGARMEIVDSLALVNPLVRRLVLDSSRFHSKWGNRIFDLSYRLITDVPPTRWFAARLTQWLAARPIRRAVLERDPDVVISTYPGATEVLGALHAQGKIDLPVVSAITDLAALRFWAHPGVDLHLITHPESEEEVREIAPASQIACVRGLTDARFYESRDQAQARLELELPSEGPVVLVSGGGWAVGDLEGAAEEALRLEGSTVVCLCGRNDELRRALADRFAGEPRVVVEGFTERMPDWFAAADLLVHSTAGLTVLEAIMSGCGVVSYGWGMGHVRVNNEAFVRFGLAEVARSREELGPAMRRALAARPAPNDYFARLPTAASTILRLVELRAPGLRLADGELGDGGGVRQQAGAHGDRPPKAPGPPGSRSASRARWARRGWPRSSAAPSTR
jgi:processive 1,2-diacylglycerol beta-glucosyltransferase